jgi:hypothetical protein
VLAPTERVLAEVERADEDAAREVVARARAAGPGWHTSTFLVDGGLSGAYVTPEQRARPNVQGPLFGRG